MKLAETLAISVLRAWLPDSSVTFVGQQSHGEHDLEIAHPDGSRGIVEVASVVDAESLNTIAAIVRGKSGEMIPAHRSKGGWYIHPTKSARIKKLRRDIDSCLARLEAAGIRSFDEHMFDVPSDLIAELEGLGVEGGDIVPFIPPGRIQLGLPSDGGWVGTAAVNNAVREAAERLDNLRKLSTGTTEERHIFVFVENSAGEPYIALFLSEELPPPPDVPPPITHVWVAAYLSTLSDVVVWRSVNNGGWTRRQLRIPSEGDQRATTSGC